MNYDKKKIINLAEFTVIFMFFILPPMLNFDRPTQYDRYGTFSRQFLLILKICLLASYEEILYRIYLPVRLKSFFTQPKYKKSVYFCFTEIFPLVFFAAAHIYLGVINAIYAFFAGAVFRTLYVLLKKKIHYIAALICIIFIHSINNCFSVLHQ